MIKDSFYKRIEALQRMTDPPELIIEAEDAETGAIIHCTIEELKNKKTEYNQGARGGITKLKST